jgi:hypothetical protein
VIISSTVRIKDPDEELIVIEPLDKKHSINLFLQHTNRVIEPKE